MDIRFSRSCGGRSSVRWCRDPLLRLLGRECPAGCRAVERRNQFWRSCRLSLRDLIILPILNIYRKYYGLKISALLLVLFYSSMSLAALAVEFLFGLLRLIPEQRHMQIAVTAIRWNYTTILNIVFLVLAILPVTRFLRTGGPAILRMMNAHAGNEDHAMHTG